MPADPTYNLIVSLFDELGSETHKLTFSQIACVIMCVSGVSLVTAADIFLTHSGEMFCNFRPP